MLQRMTYAASRADALRIVKCVHTIAWAFFASCILAIPLAALRGEFVFALVLVGVVCVEILVLMLNGMHCPLTNVSSSTG